MGNLPREDFLRIARGDDPNRPPLWNGPPHITTPYEHPERPSPHEGLLFEFLLPYPIHTFDDTLWPSLLIRRPSFELHIVKPVAANVSAREQICKGNESADMFATNFRALQEPGFKGYPLSHGDAFKVVAQTIRWIRVLTRQYWIGAGTAGVSAQYRGSAFRVEGNHVYQRNFANYGQAALIRSLKRPTWDALIHPVEADTPVPAAHSLFCDSMTSFAVGDTVLALIQLGVACEIAVTTLLDDVAANSPNNAGAREYSRLRHEQRDKFGSKLLTNSVALGLRDPRTFRPTSKPADWVDQILVLYGFRNKAAHEGRARVRDRQTAQFRDLGAGELQGFIFSAEALFRWVWEQRRDVLGTPDTPINVDDQIIAIVGEINQGGFVLDTGESHAGLR